MSSINRVAARFLTKVAGGSDFYEFGTGDDPKTVYRKLVDDAKHGHGHGGYTGTIAESTGYKIRKSIPMTKSEAYDFAEQDIDHAEKWGPALAIRILDGNVSGFLFYGIASN